jgi:cobalt/nickel transport system ATP-binding protein
VSHHIIEANDLHFTYPDGTIGLNGISFRIHHGESVALVGENGAGKSTFLMQMSGCLLPSKGTLRIGDSLLAEDNLPLIRRTVGMVFQKPDDQLFMPTVYDDVAFGLLNIGLPQEEVEFKVKQALQTVGAEDLAKRAPYKLSQGEKRNVAIAGVLAMSPDILVMDEPTSSLDPRSRRRLIELLKTFSHTKIIATHDMDMALDVCERTIVIHKGRVTADGKTEQIFKDAELLAASSLEQPFRMQTCPNCAKK